MAMKMGSSSGTVKRPNPAGQSYDFASNSSLPTDCSVPMCDVQGNILPCTPSSGGDMTPGTSGGGDKTYGSGGDSTPRPPVTTYLTPLDPILYPSGGDTTPGSSSGGDQTPAPSGGGDKSPGSMGGGDTTPGRGGGNGGDATPRSTIATPMSGGDTTPGRFGGGDSTPRVVGPPMGGPGGGDMTPGPGGGYGGGDRTPGMSPPVSFPWPPVLPNGPGLLIPDPRRGPNPSFLLPGNPPPVRRRRGMCVSQARMSHTSKGVPIAQTPSIPAYSPFVPAPVLPAPVLAAPSPVAPVTPAGYPSVFPASQAQGQSQSLSPIVGLLVAGGVAAGVWWYLSRKDA